MSRGGQVTRDEWAVADHGAVGEPGIAQKNRSVQGLLVSRPPGRHHHLTPVGKLRAPRLLVVLLATIAVLGCQAWLAGSASAETEGQAIVAAAQGIQSQAYPQQSFSSAQYIYCFDGGTTTGATPGTNDSDPVGTPTGGSFYSNCNSIGRTGFDCRGLALYAVYQGSGGAITLPTADAQAQYSDASSYGGSDVSLSSIQPGDLVFFGGSTSDVEHVGIVVSGTGDSAEIVSAVDEGTGITTETVSWFLAGFSWAGAVAIPGVGNTIGGAPSNGSFVQVSGSSAIYEIAGGAPLYVSSWSAVGGSQPYTVVSQQQFDSLSAVPSNGTFIRDEASGQIWVVAGGAPLYVAGCGNLNGCAGAVNIDVWDVQNAGDAASHLTPVPSNGTFIRDPGSGQIWVVAGGAPLAVASCSNLSGCPNPVEIDPYAVAALDHLNAVPSNGTFIRDPASGDIWVVAGGAPLFVSSCANLSGCPNPVNIDPYAVDALDHLNAVPSNGTFLETTSGSIYRVAGGSPFAVSSWSVFGGQQPYVTIDEWDIDNIANPAAHMNAVPANGTIVEGLPSDSYWSFTGGQRSPSSANPSATTVDDVGLAAFPEKPEASTPGAGPTSTSAAGATTVTPASGSTKTSTSGASAARCVVPNVRHMTLTQAKRALSHAGCRLGEVHRPRHVSRHHVLRVSSQSAVSRSRHSAKYPVNITLK